MSERAKRVSRANGARRRTRAARARVRGSGGAKPPGRSMRLRDIAHARTGDKGDTCNISLIAFDERDYPRLLDRATAERVKTLFAATSRVTNYPTSER
jgi:hypothetical protein